ncbi:MAG: hydrolase CocE/NonD family [Limisphaerales bacterium]|nr:MAG: hydrolase CocE/NonD family [Limisphaerales bacterium]KAG0508630.1 MAG: hydrolase CocE/NonD family [Limisphaerales bacterium]TXT48702.1 MAG: hydrolase CocE/NonD family [Limisphaerales bacterium]
MNYHPVTSWPTRLGLRRQSAAATALSLPAEREFRKGDTLVPQPSDASAWTHSGQECPPHAPLRGMPKRRRAPLAAAVQDVVMPPLRLLTLLTLLFLGAGAPAIFSATPAEPQDIAFTAKADGSEQRYVELLPPGFDASTPHEVLLALHGHGSDRWQFIRDARGECRGSRDVAARFGMIFVSPDYRAKTSWMGPLAEADMVQIIAELRQRHKVGRVFLVGGSMGGTAVLTFAALHPELVAGVCSLNGTANHVEYDKFQDAIAASFGGTKAQVPDEYKKRSAELWPEKFTMPVAFTTGGKDSLVPPASVLRLAEKLKQDGRKMLLLHREAGGHATTYLDTATALEFVLREAGATPLVPAGLSAEDQRWFAAESRKLADKLAPLRARLVAPGEAAKADAFAAADVFLKGFTWALRYETSLTTNDVASLKKALLRGHQRADALLANQQPWTARKGKVLRAYVSAVDGSTQPYGLNVPASYDGSKPMRLDVVLHGSSKPVGMSELKFIARFDEGDEAAKSAPDVDFIELHPLGRVENCYRWAGETDVFEAIEAVCRNYKIDRDRIVLRGMSMGASGTWHLGLKHPSRFVALGPYCGYVDTHRFSETPIASFIRVGPLPPHQERGLHMLDSIDYAANAGVVPAIAAIGDKDVFFQSHVHMKEAMAKEGLQMVNLISPGTGHTIDPVTHREQMRRIGEHVAKGLDHARKELRFVTWTLKYNRCHWLELLALGEHYERAEIIAKAADDGLVEVSLAKNITQFAIHPPMLASRSAKVSIAGQEVSLPKRKTSEAAHALVFALEQGKWKFAGPRASVALAGKRPGVQGPIDDAFASPFLCVRGTGTPWNPAVGAWTDASLRRFAYEFARYMRGDLPVKNDTEVTEADVRTKHLILFGDPGSNPWIAKALPKLPLTWTRDTVKLGTESHAAKNHAPVFISASPFPGAGDRYVVINSGHTFHEKEFAAFNYLLFPRLGDWAVMRVSPGAEAWKPGMATFPEEPIRAGYFDEQWKLTVGAAR